MYNIRFGQCYIRVEMFGGDKHSSFIGFWVSEEENSFITSTTYTDLK
jgi:hypothetical protein